MKEKKYIQAAAKDNHIYKNSAHLRSLTFTSFTNLLSDIFSSGQNRKDLYESVIIRFVKKPGWICCKEHRIIIPVGHFTKMEKDRNHVIYIIRPLIATAVRVQIDL